MRIKPEQLTAELKKGLKPIYVVAGDEPLQLGEMADVIRKAARLLVMIIVRLFQSMQILNGIN